MMRYYLIKNTKKISICASLFVFLLKLLLKLTHMEKNFNCKLKLLVRTPLKNSLNSEIKYMVEGNQGHQIWGKRISERKTKLSSIINLIHSDVMLFIL